MEAFEKKLADLINSHSLENGSNTPDFLLATYLIGCLANWNLITRARDKFFDKTPPK